MLTKILWAWAVLATATTALDAEDLTLWYPQPAAPGLTSALPIGNGRFGALVYGGVNQERVVLDEASLWTGREGSWDDYERMGSYQMLGTLLVDLAPPPGQADGPGAAVVQQYRRALDLATALHTVSYRLGGVTFTREAFASHPDQVLVLRFAADQPAACRGAVRLQGAHGETTGATNAVLAFRGTLANGLRYETRLEVRHDGGSLRAQEGRIEFDHCNSITVTVAAGTDYVMDHARHYRGNDPQATVARRLKAAAGKSYAALKAAHLADYRRLFDRVSLSLGPTPPERRALPTHQRKVRYAAEGGDPGLEEIMFQYGRYLLIACSRPGGLPANLQGLWNDSNTPPWHSDYHADINIQMNYWLAEPANLPECAQPLFDLIVSQLPAWRKATAAAPEFRTTAGPPRGWALRTSHGINGDEGWQWDITANAWYCQHFWMHYDFGRDRPWLATVAYPVLKETTEFWEDHLKALPDGRLVVPNGWSPEHGPHEDGVSYNQEIVWDLFHNYVAASAALGVDAPYRREIAALRDRLVVPQIGRWGQLQEWMTDRDDPQDHHRHTSHLFALYPGQQFTSASTPAYAAAAKKSLDARGVAAESDVREWSFAWRCALYARLGDGEEAHRMLRMLLADRNTCPNLFGLHPPMQIDGNFGITAGLCEMLLQSQGDELSLLPALPAAWPAGSVTGLRARGGITVDITWKEGKVTTYRLAAPRPRPVRVCLNGDVRTILPARL